MSVHSPPTGESTLGDAIDPPPTVALKIAPLGHPAASSVRGAYDGDYDKTNLPKELILSNYFKVRNGKIVSLVIIFNQPSPY
jgi:hypothetical protein